LTVAFGIIVTIEILRLRLRMTGSAVRRNDKKKGRPKATLFKELLKSDAQESHPCCLLLDLAIRIIEVNKTVEVIVTLIVADLVDIRTSNNSPALVEQLVDE